MKIHILSLTFVQADRVVKADRQFCLRLRQIFENVCKLFEASNERPYSCNQEKNVCIRLINVS